MKRHNSASNFVFKTCPLGPGCHDASLKCEYCETPRNDMEGESKIGLKYFNPFDISPKKHVDVVNCPCHSCYLHAHPEAGVFHKIPSSSKPPPSYVSDQKSSKRDYHSLLETNASSSQSPKKRDPDLDLVAQIDACLVRNDNGKPDDTDDGLLTDIALSSPSEDIPNLQLPNMRKKQKRSCNIM